MGGAGQELVRVERVQAYLRDAALRSYGSCSVPPFTLFFHPGDPLTHFNYAIPNEAVRGDISEPLRVLRGEFARRGRKARVEFIEAFAPALPALLEAEGFVREGRYHMMVASPDSFVPVDGVPGISVTVLDSRASDADLIVCMTVQARGFGMHAPVTLEDTDRQRALLAAGSRAFLARVRGEPAGAGVITAPADGMTEVAGIATLPEFRCRGVATVLTSVALHTAFDSGVTVATLTAGDERAGRVYERVGFRPYTAMLHYLDSNPNSPDTLAS